MALWISVAASIVVFAAVVAVRPWAGRLVSLLGPYLLVMAILGTLTDEPAPEGRSRPCRAGG